MSAIKESSDELNPAVAVPQSELPAPRKRTSSDYVALSIATCGVGFFPIAPGTLGSLVGVVFFLGIQRAVDRFVVPYALRHHLYYFVVQSTELAVMLLAIFAVTMAGIWAASRSEIVLRRKDPGAVVIDEVAGQMIALLSASFFIAGTWSIVSAFILFRTFDIWKPYPIRRLEALESGLGIMADDVAAGIYAAVVNAILIAGFLIVSSR
jgi:phosphatidylglycerophosphatase A